MSDNKPDNRVSMCACEQAAMSRRTVLSGVAATAGLAGLAAISPALAQTAPEELPPQVGDFLVSANGNTPLTVDQIRLDGSPFEAFAMAPDGTVRSSEFINQIQLLRFDPETLSPEVAAKAGDGVVGFTIICTHAGCPINEYKEGLITCSCHGSQFDPLKNGAVATGPAIRKLPQLGLTVTDGKLVVAEALDGRIGGDMSGEDDR